VTSTPTLALTLPDRLSSFLRWCGGGDVTGGIALDAGRNVYIAGTSGSTGFPVTPGAFQQNHPNTSCQLITLPREDGFVAELSSDGSHLVYSTLLGGSNADDISGISVNNRNIAFVTGSTSSADFPVTSNAFKTSLEPNATNAFVTAINPGGGALYYSSFLGGSRNTAGTAIALDPAWNAFVVGNTSDADFPTTADAFQPELKGNSDAFLSKIVIAGNLKIFWRENTSAVPQFGYVTYYAQVANFGPDGSDNVVFSDPIPPGFSFAGVYSITATSCDTPVPGATGGFVTCLKTRLEPGQSFWVNVYLRAEAPQDRI